MKKLTFRKIVRASAIYDLVLTFPFAFPVLAEWNIGQIRNLHNSFSLSGVIPEFEPLHLLFVNLMGGLVLVWSALRIYKPDPILGLFDGYSRFTFSLLLIYYLFVHNVSEILWVLFVPEMTWGIVQLFGYYSQRQET